MSVKILQENDKFHFVDNRSLKKEVPSGVYKIRAGLEGVYLQQTKITCSKIVDLPSPEFKQLTERMTKFLLPETRAKYKSYGALYKQGILLHGKPGCGKTVLVNRIAAEALSKGAIVLFDPNPDYVTDIIEKLSKTNPDTLVVVILEEFDNTVKQGYEDTYLKILDGQVQRDNTIYLATTNYKDRIPARLLRAGRLGLHIEMGLPNKESKLFFLKDKNLTPKETQEIIDSSEGLTIDELNDIGLAVKCLGYSASEALNQLKSLKKSSSYIDESGKISSDDDY